MTDQNTPASFTRITSTLSTFIQDVRLAFRLLRREPAFTVASLATLALGIGLTTAIFSVAYGVLWRPLPYPASDRLIMISSAQQTPDGVRTFATWAPRSYEGLRGRITTLDSLTAYASTSAELTGRGEPRTVPALQVSPTFFATLAVGPARGRTFFTGATAPDDDRSVIVSDRLWRTVLQADPDVLGQSLTIDGLPRTIVGVMAPTFTFTPVARDLALPEPDVFLPDRWPGDTGRNAFLFLMGRMSPQTTRQQVEAELTPLVNDASISSDDALGMEGRVASGVQRLPRTVGLQEYGTASVRTVLLMLLGAVSFVLLIACVNVATLQMARLTARRGELSVRMALGAGRGRIVRQLLTEATVLSLLGGALGALLARVTIDVTLPLVPQAVLPRLDGIVIDGRVMTFGLGLSLVSTLVVGLLPALRVGGATFSEGRALQAGGSRATGDRQGERMRTLLVAGQIAMTLILLVGAGLLIHSFVRLSSVSPGFESSSSDGIVQVVRVTLPEHLAAEPARMKAFASGVLDRVHYLPGVASASLVNSAPFGMMFIRDEFGIEGLPKPTIDAGRPKVAPDYFKTMGIPLLAGREFTPRDTSGAPNVAIISERIVLDYFPGGPAEALGRRVRLGDDGEWLTVVGVVADIRQQGLDTDVQPMIYVPFEQEHAQPFLLRFVSFVVRTTTPASVVEGIRAEIRRIAPDLPIAGTTTMDEAVAASVAAPRFRTVLLGLFAAAATLIATCGLYGLMAYSVTQRRREIGVRIALGATRRDVLRLVLMHALRIVGAGLVVGLLGAAGVTRVLQTFLFGIAPTDPLVFAVVTSMLLAVGLLAAWLPARRAARINPWAALRTD
jgi:putative ABC transport system permease protein